MIWALVGCGGLGLDVPDGTKDSGEAAVSIAALDPDWGLPDAETPVTISGTGFEGTVTAFFGNAEVAVTKIDAGTLVTTAPAAGVEAAVDVRVVSDLGEATLPGGFTYAEEEPTDPTDTTDTTDTTDPTDTHETNAGKVGGLVQFSLLQVACPSCLGYSEALLVDATAGFHAPTTRGWLEWLPAEGSCAVNPSPSAPASAFLDGGQWVYLTSGSVSVGLRQADGIYAASGLGEADYVRNAAYDLSMPESGADLDDFDVIDAFTTPQVISDLSPIELLYTTPQTAFAARIRASAASFTWSPSGGPDSFLILVDVYTPQGNFQDEIACLGADSGSLTVPSGYLSGYANGSLLVVGMYRYVMGGFERPDDGSTVETLVTFGVLGTGELVR